MILSQIYRSGAMASALNTAVPAFSNIQAKSRFESSVTTSPTLLPYIPPIASFALPLQQPESTLSMIADQPEIVSFALPPAPHTNEYGAPIYPPISLSPQSHSVVSRSISVYTSTRNASTATAVAAIPEPQEEKRQPSRFQIPVPLDASKIRSIPKVREMLVQHAQDTYNRIGKIEFDVNREQTVAGGSDTAVIPLSSNELLKLYYLTHRNKARYGMLIEQLDMFATWIGYKHNQMPGVNMEVPAHHTIGVVTAFVDRIDVHQEQGPAADKDIFYHGYTSWVGKSSSEVVVHVQQKHSDDDIRELMTAKFVMVTLGEDGKAAPNVKLTINSQEELARFNEAERSKKLRSLIQNNSLAKCNPTASEVSTMHQMHMNMADPSSLTLQRHKAARDGYVFMEECVYQKSLICFPFQRNLHNKMFGGYLMRKAYEAAFINAQLFSKSVPRFIFGGEIVFQKAVPIGALLWLNSQICYTKNNQMQVTVIGQVLNNKTNQLETCNTFQYSFKTDDPLPSVIPTTYADNLRYMTAKRHFETFVENKKPSDEFH